MTDYDPRLVALYDKDNPDGPDHDFYRSVADEIAASSILDLGCGTGILTVSFARPGRSVVGVDPSREMLAYAERRPGAERVTWLLGDSRAVPDGPFDYVVMSGNVAQHISGADWSRTLTDLRRSMRRGGVLAFESRNPAARAWTRWTSPTPVSRITAYGSLREWSLATEIAPGRIRLEAHNVFEKSGDHVVETAILAFRHREEIEDDLSAAGFQVEAVFGDWNRGAATRDSALMVFRAQSV
jgi:SAM-dependent methyltransferase